MRFITVVFRLQIRFGKCFFLTIWSNRLHCTKKRAHFPASHFYFLPRLSHHRSTHANRSRHTYNPAGWILPERKVPFATVTGKSKKSRCNKIPTHYAVLSAGNASEDIALARRRGGQCSLVGRCSHVGRDVRELTLFRQHNLRSCRECRYLTFPNCGPRLISHRFVSVIVVLMSIWRFFYVRWAIIGSAWTRYLFTSCVVEFRKEGLLFWIGKWNWISPYF